MVNTEKQRTFRNQNMEQSEPIGKSLGAVYDLVCLSHLRWDFVYQRPQHLMARFAREHRVFFIEEPVFVNDQMAQLNVSTREGGAHVVVPYLPKGLSEEEIIAVQRMLVNELFVERKIDDHVLWYYTPMALAFTKHLSPLAVVYDCMDELSAFRGAPQAMRERESLLLKCADVVFTGGQSLYEAKRNLHPNIHPFPSSIDAAHFAQARMIKDAPADQANIPHPRIGFSGVIDERMDTALLDHLAETRPDWHLIMVGPVVKIDAADLPRRPNIHYLGGKKYEELPAYLAGWDVSLLPFALNESTRFISPTKTPEYLAAGKPVVSTPIRDVVRPYGEMKLVHIAETGEEFVVAIEAALGNKSEYSEWLLQVDDFLAKISWDQTWLGMNKLIEAAIKKHKPASAHLSRTATVSPVAENAAPNSISAD